MIFAALQVVMAVFPHIMPVINESVLVILPYLTFIMYCINRGIGFTKALFMYCDHSLMTYAFYKQPKYILRLFVIRLCEIMKINAMPALVIGLDFALVLYTSGGTENVLDYAVMIISVLCTSLFFLLHNLVIYYLLQPYSLGTELKSAAYIIVNIATYFVCWILVQQQISILLFGTLTIVFVVIYCITASIMVYIFAPKTFRLRL